MSLPPYLTAFIAVSLYASLGVIAKRSQAEIPSFAFIAITMAMLAVLSALASFFYEKDFSTARIGVPIWRELVLFSVVNFIGFTAYLAAIARLPISVYQMIGLTTPLVGGLLAYIFLGEDFKIRYLIGLAIISAGLCVALYAPDNKAP